MAGFRSQVLGIAFCILLRNDWISYVDLDERNRKNQPDLFEAATIDGANKPQQFRYMTVPLLKGVFKTNITMWTVSTAAFFVWSQLFSTVTADKATIVPVQYMYMHTFGAGNAVTERNAGYGAAIGIILCVCVVIVFSICNKLIKDDDLEF